MASPTEQGVKFAKKQLIAIKSPSSTIAPATTQGKPYFPFHLLLMVLLGE